MRDEAGAPVLYTAREGVLLGTVRDLALKLCPQLGIKVVEEPPSIQQLQRAEEVRRARVSGTEGQHAQGAREQVVKEKESVLGAVVGRM